MVHRKRAERDWETAVEAPSESDEAAAAVADGDAGGELGAESIPGIVIPLDQHQRLLAEFDNYRKRVERERERQALLTRVEMLGRLLPILDDFQRARRVLESQESATQTEGLLIIMNRFADLLKREGLETVPAAPGDAFDPEVHEAVLMVPTAEVPAGSIAEVLEQGYRVADRLLRATKVAVARVPESQPDAAGD